MSEDPQPTFVYQYITILLDQGADPNALTDCGRRPLHSAVSVEDGELLKLLLRYGADPTLKDNHGRTPYDLAVERNFFEIAHLLEQNLPGRTTPND
jgi:ankyrin repeat protein